jgi:hypothetical protein
MFSDSKILIFSGLLFIAAALSLAWVSGRELDPNDGKSWWAVSFVNTENGSLDFSVANHSDATGFSYEILHGNAVLASDTLTIDKGTTQMVPVATTRSDVRTTVSVWTDPKDKREIYK